MRIRKFSSSRYLWHKFFQISSQTFCFILQIFLDTFLKIVQVQDTWNDLNWNCITRHTTSHTKIDSCVQKFGHPRPIQGFIGLKRSKYLLCRIRFKKEQQHPVKIRTAATMACAKVCIPFRVLNLRTSLTWVSTDLFYIAFHFKNQHIGETFIFIFIFLAGCINFCIQQHVGLSSTHNFNQEV